MNEWTLLDRRILALGYTIKIHKMQEDPSNIRDMYYEETEEFLKDIEDKIADGDLEFFQLRVQATKRDYVLGETYMGGFLYVDAEDVLSDNIIDDMIATVIADAIVESKILKELL